MASAKVKCKYWNKCYNTESAHRKQFLHPADDDDDDEDSDDGSMNATLGKKKASNGVDLEGKVVVFTGALVGCTRNQAEARAREFGCFPRGTVSKNTDIVIVGSDAGVKADKAEDLGIKTMSQTDWDDLLSQAKPLGKAASRSRKAAAISDSEDEDYEAKPKKKKPKKKPALVHAISLTDDEDDSHKKKMTKKKTHSVSSDSDTDMDIDEPTPSTSKKRKSFDSDTESEDDGKAKKKTKKLKRDDDDDDSPKIKCMYWEKCYRKDPYHLAQYRHPATTIGTKGVLTRRASEVHESQKKGGGTTAAAAAKAGSPPKPKNKMEDGESIDFGTGIGKYRIKRTGDHYYCTCLAWKNQKHAITSRTCKHLKQYLGEEFEKHRVGDQGTSGEKTIHRAPRHKNIPQLLLAHKYNEGTEYKGWWISEKLDGVRAYWDGKAFYSRLGNEFIPPPWFVKGFPNDMELDGELFGGRGKFQSTVSIVKTPGSAKWKELTYEIFDCPSLGGHPFEKRLDALAKLERDNTMPYARIVEHDKCKGKEHLEEELERVEDLGGEGLMIREPHSKYVNGRSHTLLKIKTFHDAEARVIGHEPGKGKNASRCGALRCVMECGKKFSVGSGLSDKDRIHPPKIGTIITYKFQELTNSGVPRFPSYIGIRIDMTKPKDAVLKKKPDA